jgi:hypothetical protein
MALVEDLSLFLTDFGQAATLDGAAVTVIFDEEGVTAAGGIAAVAPQVTLPTASVPASPFGKTLTIGARSFTVREHLPDGTGMSTLVLTDA